MRVALVHDYLNQSGGAERVLKSFTEIFPDAPIFTLIYDAKGTNFEFAGKEVKTSFLQKIPGSRKFHRAFALLMPLAIEHLDLSGFDIVLSDTECFGKGVLTHPDALHISYCHTPPRFLWEGYQHNQRALPFFVKPFAPFFLSYLRIWDLQASRRVDTFLANSNFVAARIKKYYRRDARVIYPPVSLNQFKKPFKKEDYYLLLMRLVPYKRPEIVIEAFNRLGFPLKVVGDGPLLPKLKTMAHKNIEFLGAKPHTEVASFFGKAKALVFPQEEDFGISALESCASGTPVIAFGKGGATEILKEGVSGVFFHQQTPEALVQAVKNFQKKRFDDKIIRESVNKFDETRFKQEVLEVIKSSNLKVQSSKLQLKSQKF